MDERPTNSAGKPDPQPIAGPDRLREALRAAADGATGRDVRVAMHVAGGLSSQAYRFDFMANDAGEARCELHCALSGRRAEARQEQRESKHLVELSGQILETGLLDLPHRPRRFLPDTVIGVIEIAQGDAVFEVSFAADPAQAETQDATPPEPVQRVAELIYRRGAEMIGVDNAAP